MERLQIPFYIENVGSNPPLQSFGDIGKSEHTFKADALSLKFENTGAHSAVQIIWHKDILHKHRLLGKATIRSCHIAVRFCSLSGIFERTGDWTDNQ
jgi:hypothetical protein